MASRKKTPDPETVPDEVEIEAKQVKPPTRKVVETKTVTYDAPANEEETPDDEPEFELEEKPRRSKPTLKEEKQKLRDRWAKRGIAPTGNLRISLWRFTNEDDPMSGAQADKAFCSKFVTTESAIDDGIHLDAASKFGPGRYWIMIYLNNQIVDQWEFRIAAGQQMSHVQNGQQMVSMPDPQNPNVIVQMPANQPLPAAIDPLKQMRESFKMMKEMREAMGMIEPQQQQNPQQLSPELQMAGFMLQDADLKKKAIKSLFGTGGGEPEKDILTTVIENVEPIGKAIQGIIQQIFVNIQEVRGNGAASVAQAAFTDNGQVNSQQQEHGQTGEIQAIQEANGQALQGSSESLPQGAIAIRPEDELLAGILDHCKRKMPPKLAADRAMKYAEYIENIAPHQSVFTIIEAFTDNPVAESLALLAMANDEAAEVVAMPHAEAWATQLQAELKKAYEPGGENAA